MGDETRNAGGPEGRRPTIDRQLLQRLRLYTAYHRDDFGPQVRSGREEAEARRRAVGLTCDWSEIIAEFAREQLPSFKAYLRAGHSIPAGTPRQTKWAQRIKADVWPRLWAAISDFYLVERDFPTHFSRLWNAGYVAEVAPVFRALLVVMTLDELDRRPARFWIDLRVERRGMYEKYRRADAAVAKIPRDQIPPRAMLPEPPPPEAELAVRRTFYSGGMISTDDLLKRFPTPLEWIAELRRRHVRCDSPPTDLDIKYFNRSRTTGGDQT
jgi:hypothetical protein